MNNRKTDQDIKVKKEEQEAWKYVTFILIISEHPIMWNFSLSP